MESTQGSPQTIKKNNTKALQLSIFSSIKEKSKPRDYPIPQKSRPVNRHASKQYVLTRG
jgi:hypothetical protein